ncbi:MAG: hypothetical protein HYY00_07660 [Chloroflexi bacterium]|nr:hypothetical protein [Chloroflexota bacterium]
MSAAVPLVTALVSLLFFASLVDQQRRRPRPYRLVWALGLLLYFLASAMQTIHELATPNATVLRLWYWAGAMLVPAYLGTGTLYLLAPRRVAHPVMALLAVLTVLGLVLLFTTTLRRPLSELEGQALTGRGFFPGGVVAITIVLNTYGTVAVVGGALWSAVSFWRRHTMGYRVLSNVLIAAGALVAAAGGTLDRLGIPEPHAVALLLGLVIIYVGFLRSREVFEFPIAFLQRRPAER